MANSLNLLVNYYIDKNIERQTELDFCLSENINSGLFDNIFVFSDTEFKSEFANVFYVKSERPTYNDYFDFANLKTKKDDIWILSNTDIIFNDTIKKVLSINLKNTILALSRNDCIRPDSQDVWIWQNEIRKPFECNFNLGIAGCDNRIAYLMNERGYNVINPCSIIKVEHIHKSNVRNYIKDGVVERLLPPYRLVNPC